jgi:hypothetical protein
MNTADQRGVFDEIVGKRAFFHRVALSVWGSKRRPSKNVHIQMNKPIGGKGRAYARAERGTLRTGIAYELRYGLSGAKRFMPPMMLILRSEQSPLTVIDTITAVRALCGNVTRASISEVEVAFDVKRVSVDFFRRRILSSARTFTQIPPDRETRTLYVRGRKAPWQARIYEKSPTVTRFEYVLRSAHLRKVGVDSPLDLVALRRLPLNSLISLRELDEVAFRKLVARLDDLTARVVQGFRRKLTLQEFLHATRDVLKVPKSAFLKPAIAKRFEKMQRRLIYDPYLLVKPLPRRARVHRSTP